MFEEAAARIAFKTADVAGLRLFYREMSMVPNPKRRTEVIVQHRRRIMRARIGKAGFLTGTALPCGVAQQEARRRCLRASIASVGGLLNVTPQTNQWFCSSQT